ncbi:hypothetical protein J6590_071529 [Homalodisca vitripennis]|nr:hypothetical protein J6590_071529 [Homalodisca vitripennis]
MSGNRSGPSNSFGSTSVSDTPPALDTPFIPCTGPAYSTPGLVYVLIFTPSGEPSSGSPKSPVDLVEGISQLKKEIERLLDLKITSNTRLLSFIDDIFTVNNSLCVNQIVRASTTVDCGLPFGPPEDSTPVLVDFSVHCDLPRKSVSSAQVTNACILTALSF